METSWTVRANDHRRIAGIALAMIATALAGACASTGETAPTGKRTSYAFWPLAPDTPRIQFLKSYRSSQDVREAKQSGFERLVFGQESTYEAVIEKPYGIDMHEGRIYVCDIRRPSLTVLDIPKKEVRLIGTTGTQQIAHPVDVSVADDGWIYVADNDRNAILVFDPRERYARTYGHPGMKPVSLAVHGDKLYVCDLQNQDVEIFDRNTGSSLGTFGSPGDEDGQFRVPIGIDVDRDGYVYVSDMMRCRIQKFTPDGKFVSGFGELGDYAGSFARPKQLAVDKDGIIYVVDAAFQNVQMFNKDFELLMAFGAAGSFPGAMNLPAGICVSDEGLDLYKDDVHPGFDAYRLIAVTNQFGPDTVSIYALGRLRKGWTVAQLAASAADVSSGTGQNPSVAPLQGNEGTPPPETTTPPPDAPEPPEPAGERKDAAGGDGG